MSRAAPAQVGLDDSRGTSDNRDGCFVNDTSRVRHGVVGCSKCQWMGEYRAVVVVVVIPVTVTVAVTLRVVCSPGHEVAGD